MPEKSDKKDTDLVDKNKNCLNHCNKLKSGQTIKVFIGDVLVIDEIITEENINMIGKHICNGCKYFIK